MRVVVEHRCRRLDLSPVERLVPALVGEWTGLRFGPDGRLLAPSGEPDDRLHLTSGHHDHPGATYLVQLPDDDGTVGARQVVRLDASSAAGDRREVTVGPAPGSVPAGSPAWSARLRLADLSRGPLDKARLPSASGAVDVDLRPVTRHAGMPRLLGPLALLVVGRDLRVEGEADPSALTATAGARSLLRASGRCGRWRADLVVEVRTGDGWDATCTLELGARGPGRLVLAAVGRRRVERWVREVLDAVAGPQALDEQERDLRRTADETDAAGGPVPYVREQLWGDGRAVVGGST